MAVGFIGGADTIDLAQGQDVQILFLYCNDALAPGSPQTVNIVFGDGNVSNIDQGANNVAGSFIYTAPNYPVLSGVSIDVTDQSGNEESFPISIQVP